MKLLAAYGKNEYDPYCEIIHFPFQGFIKAKNYPPTTSVETENDGSESAVFRQLFQKWTVHNQTTGIGKTHTVGKIGNR